MTATNVRVQMQQRKDTAANWASANPTLLSGELGYETDTGKWKVGTGSAAWSSLAYTNWSQISYPIATADIADDAVTGAKLANNIDIAGTLDVTSAATFDNNVVVQGNLTVNGTTTTIDTTTLLVKDKNIELGVITPDELSPPPSDFSADGGGITLKGTTDKTITWIDATDAWTFSEHLDIASGKEYRINGTKVLDATSLGSAVVGSSLTSVGTIGAGVWNGTAIASAYIADSAITSAKIADGAIVDADVNASAAIAGTKVSPDFGSQAITTTGIINANGKVSFPLGTAALPSLYPGSDTDTGIYSPGANQLAISTNGTQALYINADGNILVADGNRMEIDEVRARDGAGLKLFDDAGAGIFVEDGGNVGIGTSAPSTQLAVVEDGSYSAITASSNVATTGLASRFALGNSVGTARFTINMKGGGGEEAYLGSEGAFPIYFQTTGTERMRIDSSGNVGIGLSASLAGLCVNSTIRSQNSSSNISYIGFTTYQASATVGTMFSYMGGDARSTGYLNFNTNDTERLRIDSSGRLLVGCTSFPSASVRGFGVEGNGDMAIGTNTTGSDRLAEFFNPNGRVGGILVSGTSTTFETSSDYRLKENVISIVDGITRVKQLSPKRFNFIADDTTIVDGFIAHEAQTVVPEAVTGEKDGEEMQGIDQSKLVPLLTAALQEAIAKIETLEQRLSDAGIA